MPTLPINLLPTALKLFWRNYLPANAFLVIAAVVGLAFCVITPPFQVPDEVVHFYRAYQISEGHLIARPVKGGYGNLVPQKHAQTSYRLIWEDQFSPWG